MWVNRNRGLWKSSVPSASLRIPLDHCLRICQMLAVSRFFWWIGHSRLTRTRISKIGPMLCFRGFSQIVQSSSMNRFKSSQFDDQSLMDDYRLYRELFLGHALLLSCTIAIMGYGCQIHWSGLYKSLSLWYFCIPFILFVDNTHLCIFMTWTMKEACWMRVVSHASLDGERFSIDPFWREGCTTRPHRS